MKKTSPLCGGRAAIGNPAPSILSTPTESPDSRRLLGPLWCSSGITLQAGCRVYCGDHWASGTIAATGSTFALVKTAAGVERCSDRRNLLTEGEAVLFKLETAAFRRRLKKRQGGQSHG